ncbi:hypothetical protein I6A84_16850 [Frankia sp. CNm7]|uniref:WD40 repeat domain-containing protein n=1 Tax=Frankia nepalensis TaxID=1836974 RepID=UPI001931D89E|nr:hypothetical protein [Frankia nepalensis]MBL7519722.1 hypothetical protein [Frankia nepalensis]
MPESRNGARGSGRRRVALVVAGLVVLGAVAVGVPLALSGGGGGGNGDVSAARRAELSTALAQQADALRASDPERAARLSLAAYRIEPTADAERAMVASFAAASWVDLPGTAAAYTGGALSADGRFAAATDTNGHLRLWDLSSPASPTQVADVALPAGSGTPDAAGPLFLPDAGLVTAGAVGHTWTLGDPGAPTVVGDIPGQVSQPLQLSVSGDGKLLAIANRGQDIEIWNLSNPAAPTHVGYRRIPGIVTDIAISPDARMLAVAEVDGTATLFDITNPADPVERGQTAGQSQQVNAVAFLPDSKRLVTGGDDGTVRVWDLADPASPKQVNELRGRGSAVVDVVPVGSGYLASAEADGTLLGWDLASPSPAGFTLDSEKARRDLAADGTGTRLLSVPEEDAGTPAVGTTDPAQLVAVACQNPANRIDEQEWNDRVTDLAYQDPCAG